VIETSSCSGNNVGGAGIRREVLQDVQVYVTACPCDGDDLTRMVAVDPDIRTMLHPLHNVRFTLGSILTVVFCPTIFIDLI